MPQEGGVPVLQMRGICKQYPGVRALAGTELEVRAGEVHILLGENGAGKSTLMKILSGACRADAGQVLVDGKPVDISDPPTARALGISTIYQELTLVPHLSVAENVFLGKAPARWPGIVDWARMRRETARILHGLGVEIDPDTRVRDLRLAQQQMVEVARARRLGTHSHHGRADVGAERAGSRAALRNDRTADGERCRGDLHLAPHGRGLPHRLA